MWKVEEEIDKWIDRQTDTRKGYLFRTFSVFSASITPSSRFSISSRSFLFVYNMKPNSQQDTWGGETWHTHTQTHTHTHTDLIAAAGTMPSCLGLSMCKGRAVRPHQCQHVAYMYTAPGGPVCALMYVCVCPRLLSPLPIGYPVTMWGQQQSSLHWWPQSHLICVSTFYEHAYTQIHTDNI